MTSDSSEWDEDLPPDPEEDYQTFIRTLERTDGFRLLFVQCTPAEGKQLIARVKDDLPEKTIEVLCLDQPIENLYQIVEQLPNREQVNILFIQGLEHSFYEYERIKFGDTHERDFYSWKGVPRILNHLNQHRERFRDTFKICFVFLLRPFSLKYFIHRAPDFFDWRSSVFEFPTTPEILEQESSRILQEGDYEEYLTLTPEERIKKVLDIQELLQENHQTPSSKASLLIELGDLFYCGKVYEAAIANYDQALKVRPDDHYAWSIRGDALKKLGRYEEALASYDQALKVKPDYHYAWGKQGDVLDTLRRYEEALASYDQALKVRPDDHYAWDRRGDALKKLGRYEEALASYDQALKAKPDYHYAWSSRGDALEKLGRYEEALASYDQALKVKPDYHYAWDKQGDLLDTLGRYEEALASYDQALTVKPDYHYAWGKRGYILYNLSRYEEAIASFEKVLKITPDDYQAWNNRGYLLLKRDSYEGVTIVYEKALEIGFNRKVRNKKTCTLYDLERYEEALASFDKALEIQPDFELTWANRSFVLYYLGYYQEALVNCNKALELKYDDYVAWSHKGFVLMNLERYEEALTSFDKVLEIQPSHHIACYNKACCYALRGNIDEAIENLQQAINLSPDEYREMAKTDSDFDSIREDERFQMLIQEPLPSN